MNNESKMKSRLIDYIKANDSFYKEKNIDLEEFSITDLVIIKSEIEIAINRKKG
jgi:hypothetical protein